MKRIALFLSLCGLLFATEQPTAAELREQIQVYKNRAKYADRQAQRLMTLDYTSYRFYIQMREKNLGMVTALEKELQKIDPSYVPEEKKE